MFTEREVEVDGCATLIIIFVVVLAGILVSHLIWALISLAHL